MFLRWIHKTWKIFWRLVLAILLIVLIFSGAIIGILQLEPAQEYLSDRLEEQVEQHYKVDLTIGDIKGVLPFKLALEEVVLTAPQSLNDDTLATVDHLEGEIDLWSLLQNRVNITSFTLDRPRLWVQLDEEGRFQFMDRTNADRQPRNEKDESSWFGSTEIIAPVIQVFRGKIYVESVSPEKTLLNFPSSFALSDITTNLFFEWSQEQRFLDIESFSAESSQLQMGDISFAGQIYSGDQQLEVNSFGLNLNDSHFTLNGGIDGVQLNQTDFIAQLADAHYNLHITSNGFRTHNLQDLLEWMPNTEEEFYLEVDLDGTTDSLQVNKASLGTGESDVQLKGYLYNPFKGASLAYNFQFQGNSLRSGDIQPFFSNENLKTLPFEDFSLSGNATGTLDSAQAEIALSGPMGEFSFKGNTLFQKPYRYKGEVRGTSVNLNSIVPEYVDTSSLTFDAQLEGFGFSLQEAVSKASVTFTNSSINDIYFDQFEFTSKLEQGIWRNKFNYSRNQASLSGSGSVDFTQQKPPLHLSGSANNIDLTQLFDNPALASSQLDFGYNIEIRGLQPDLMEGRANIDVEPSVINGDTVRAHQLYMDLSSADAANRSFRLTSSLFDMDITGHLVPSTLLDQANYWGEYLQNRFQAEILMNAPVDTILEAKQPDQNAVFNGSITTKDLSLIRRYFPDFPAINSDSEISFDVNTSGNRLLFSAELQVDSLQYEQSNIGNAHTQLTASFRGDRSLKDFATVDFDTEIESLTSGEIDLKAVGVGVSLKQDSLNYSQQVGSISDNARFSMNLNSTLSDTSISVAVSNFFFGNNEYAWINRETPSLVYKRTGEVELGDFRFQNKSEYFELRGTLSSDRKDSLIYDIQNVHLDRISRLINGEITFGGILNGSLITKSLTSQPTIQGDLTANRFTLNDRIVGDVTFNSQYNPQEDRFDTGISVTTDTVKYEEYLEDNDDIGQNLFLKGYFVTPRPNVDQDTVFYFDADFQQIDMWIVPLIVDNIFEEMEGQATGTGYVTGNLEDFDFNAEFQTENVFAKPRFVETNYFVSGPVTVDRQDGVILDSLNVIDTKGGSGTVWGTIDLNNFSPITYLDLSADLDQLQFLNSSYDPDIPFYGKVSGTGLVRLTGSNTDMYMRTEKPMQLSSDSDVSIPLMEQTELNESGRFIRFVNSFEDRFRDGSAPRTDNINESDLDEEEIQAEIQGLTFSERFDLDLQFTSSNDVTVRLIFDPVTGEVLTSQGSGQIRLTMQDQDVQMFGRYTIDSGNYQFVTGEIISRRLELESGGTIVWEGEPDNARLDISAVYNARPNISTLMAERPVDTQSQSGQQMPIDLIVEINGTLNSVENNYFFRLPPSLDLSSSSTVTYTINQINRDEQQKLLQATSILFTGQFIPTQGVDNATATLGENLSKGSTVLNPLLSNQVISPLLSNQINALLNSDVSRFDVDFNLNAYNEVDLGIALRLYNDRLILRREGQITGGGPQSTLGDRIGDLNATYRIQQGLSLTAFHRQDQILGSYGASGAQAGDVTPSVDGIGFEAQVQFNSWKGLMNKINNFFGTKKEDEETDNHSNLTKQKAVEEK